MGIRHTAGIAVAQEGNTHGGGRESGQREMPLESRSYFLSLWMEPNVGAMSLIPCRIVTIFILGYAARPA
jgi:hypothetical protein